MSRPVSPKPVASISDGREFDRLDGAISITTAWLDGSLYALVASVADNGIQIINITDPASPKSVASVSDGMVFDERGKWNITGGDRFDHVPIVATFDELAGARSITTVQIRDSLYALVASVADSGVQIIDISDPAFPVPAASISDGEDFDELSGANSITTIWIDKTPYALVASVADNGVQIIDISDPHNPVPAASISDGEDFDELSGANSITTIWIDKTPYALVASVADSGVQIIDISDPHNPVPAASISDGEDFDELSGVMSVAAVRITGHPYALTASWIDDGIQIIDITDPTDPAPAASLHDKISFDKLVGANSMTTVSIGESTYSLTASVTNNEVRISDISNPHNPVPVASISDGADFDELSGANSIATITIDDSHYALVASWADDGVQIIDITDPTDPAPVASISDGEPFDKLAGAASITTITIDDSHYALVASWADDGVQIIDITDPTDPAPVASISDGEPFDKLAGAASITTITIDDSHYALVASWADDGVQIIDITNPGNPISISSASDGLGGFDELAGAVSITTAVIYNTPYALVASFADNGVQIIDLTKPKDPRPVASMSDGDVFDRLAGVVSIDTIQIHTAPYAVVASVGDSGAQIIRLSDPHSPELAASMFDGAVFDGLAGTTSVVTTWFNGRSYVLAGSWIDDEIQIINIFNPYYPRPVGSISDKTVFDRMAETNSVTTARVGNSTYALIASVADLGIRVIDISDPASPVPVVPVYGKNMLDGLTGVTSMSTAVIAGSTYALVASITDNGMWIIDMSDPAIPEPVAFVRDGEVFDGTDDKVFDELDGTISVATVRVGDSTYALAAGWNDDGIQIIDISDPHSPVPVASIRDDTVTDEAGFDRLGGARSITTAVIGDSTYALVASVADNGVQIIDISDPHSPEPTASVSDGILFDRLAGAISIDSAVIGNSTYAIVASILDHGVQIIDISDPHSPEPAASMTDGISFRKLAGAMSVAAITTSDAAYVLVASILDHGVQIIDIFDPRSPRQVAIVYDGKVSDELKRAISVATVVVDGSPYALATSWVDENVQIISIRPPFFPVAGIIHP